MTQVEWLLYPGVSDDYVRGRFQVTTDEESYSVDVAMTIWTVTAFASAQGVEGAAEQVALAERVLKAWGRREIEGMIQADQRPATELVLERTRNDAEALLDELGPLTASGEP